MLAWVQKIVGVMGRFRTPICSYTRAFAVDARRRGKRGIERPQLQHACWREMLTTLERRPTRYARPRRLKCAGAQAPVR